MTSESCELNSFCFQDNDKRLIKHGHFDSSLLLSTGLYITLKSTIHSPADGQ